MVIILNPRNVFNFILKILAALYILFILVSVPLRPHLNKTETRSAKLVEKYVTNGDGHLRFQIVDTELTYSLYVTDSWYESAKMGDTDYRERNYFSFDQTYGWGFLLGFNIFLFWVGVVFFTCKGIYWIQTKGSNNVKITIPKFKEGTTIEIKTPKGNWKKISG